MESKSLFFPCKNVGQHDWRSVGPATCWRIFYNEGRMAKSSRGIGRWSRNNRKEVESKFSRFVGLSKSTRIIDRVILNPVKLRRYQGGVVP